MESGNVCMVSVSTLQMIQRLNTPFYHPLSRREVSGGDRAREQRLWVEEEGGGRWEDKGEKSHRQPFRGHPTV